MQSEMNVVNIYFPNLDDKQNQTRKSNPYP
jgi:hypothetical protein